MMKLPLDEILKLELNGKHDSRPFLREFRSTISYLNRQFQSSESDSMDVRQAMSVLKEVDGTKSHGLTILDI